MSSKVPVYKFIATQLSRVKNLENSNAPRSSKVFDALCAWVKKNGPSGSGIDMGTALSETSTMDCIVLGTHFHHMDEHGGYDGWTDHMVRCKASMLFGIDVTVSGRDRNQIKEYLGEMYQRWLLSEMENIGLIEDVM